MKTDCESKSVLVNVDDSQLRGDLAIPDGATGFVLFAHGSGSSRLSPRNQYVSQVLVNACLGTLLIDLLTPEEEYVDLKTRHFRFDIDMLSDRLVQVIDWLVVNQETEGLKIGLFGASTGAAAAIRAAARRSKWVSAVVSRGGRPDLAGAALDEIECPTLLIVGSEDHEVMTLNRKALAKMSCIKKLATVCGASHLFEEPGTLEEAATLAKVWFQRYLK